MNISGMRPYEGFYEYNSIKAVALRSQQIAAVQNASGDEELSGGSQPQGQTQTKRPQTYNAFDYAKEYQPDETYELKGADSDLAGLDMQKAISDMEKDQVLQQYQYFVGTQDTGVKKTPVGYRDFCFAFRREFFPLVHNTQRRDLCAHFYIRMNIWIPLTA